MPGVGTTMACGSVLLLGCTGKEVSGGAGAGSVHSNAAPLLVLDHSHSQPTNYPSARN